MQRLNHEIWNFEEQYSANYIKSYNSAQVARYDLIPPEITLRFEKTAEWKHYEIRSIMKISLSEEYSTIVNRVISLIYRRNSFGANGVDFWTLEECQSRFSNDNLSGKSRSFANNFKMFFSIPIICDFRLHPVDEQIPVAKLLMSFSKGCGAVLELMQASESPCSSEGYHSEPESECDSG